MGKAEVLAHVERHDWNLRATSRTLGTCISSLRYFLRRHAAVEMTTAQTAGRFRRYRGRALAFQTAGELIKLFDRYEYSIKRVAAATERSPETVSLSLRRLAPDVYERLPELRRAA